MLFYPVQEIPAVNTFGWRLNPDAVRRNKS